MNKAENNEQFDTDILQCKADILRARNTTPLHNITQKNPDTGNSSATAKTATQQNTGSIPIETRPARKKPPLPMSPDEKEEAGKTSEIPKFDLAEELMAEQRRITAIRRKAPGGKPDAQRLKPEPQPVEHINEEPKPALSEQDKIIAEIVARDIESMCRGDYSGQ